MSITFDDDKDVDAFLPGAQAILKLDDAYPPALAILNRLYFEGNATSKEYSLLRKAILQGLQPTMGQRIRAWWRRES